MSRKSGIMQLVKPYRAWLILLIVFTLLSNVIELLIPHIVSESIDAYTNGSFYWLPVTRKFLVVILCVLLFTYLRGYIQVYISELVARDIRNMLMDKITRQNNSFVDAATPIRLVTNVTHDVDAIKNFIALTLVTIFSSLFVIAGAAVFMIQINWKLALYVLGVIPVIGTAFLIVSGRVKRWFGKSRTAFDQLNTIVNENVLGAALIRTVRGEQREYEKFFAANEEIKRIEFSILHLLSLLIPMIRFTGNIAGLSILLLGGYMVIEGQLSLGDFAAFNGYLGMIIFPIFTLGMMGNVVVEATTCYERISGIIDAADLSHDKQQAGDALQEIALEEISLTYSRKIVLDQISFSVQAGARVAIVGPTASGKTQLLHLIAGFIKPAQGIMKFNGKAIDNHGTGLWNNRVGFVFQDSFLFNATIRENIAFNDSVTDESLRKAIETAELDAFIDALPDKLDTMVSERGSSLSGGQKQRIMLARALAGNPQLLLLDDFLARLDANTGKKIMANIRNNYSGVTIISVAQKIDITEDYDQVILLMQGTLIASGRHQDLIASNEEYLKLFNLQRSTRSYEI